MKLAFDDDFLEVPEKKQTEISYESSTYQTREDSFKFKNHNGLESYYSLYSDNKAMNYLKLGTESADDAFSDIGGDGTADESFESEGDDGGDPFGDTGDFGSDDDSDDIFGGGGDDDFFADDGDGEEAAKVAPKVIERNEVIKEKYDISIGIRQNIPRKMNEMIETINNNVMVVERAIMTIDNEDNMLGLKEAYNSIREQIENYMLRLGDKTYDDIFETYLKFYSILSRLRKLFDDIFTAKQN